MAASLAWLPQRSGCLLRRQTSLRHLAGSWLSCGAFSSPQPGTVLGSRSFVASQASSAEAPAQAGGASASRAASPPPPPAAPSGQPKMYRERLLDGEEEILTEAEKKEKDEILRELTRKLSGPLADENGNVPTGKDRPIAIEVDGPSHFYANSTRYTAYTKLKHRLLTRMGYKVLHVPYFEWRKCRGAKEREEYMRKKLMEEPTEWLDPEDEKYYTQAPADDEEERLPPTPPPPPPRSQARMPEDASASPSAGASSADGGAPTPPPPPRRTDPPPQSQSPPKSQGSPPPPPPPVGAGAPPVSPSVPPSPPPTSAPPPPPPGPKHAGSR